MRRRDFCRVCFNTGALGALGGSLSLGAKASAPYEGRFLVTLHTDGGWDVASFCDPKANRLGKAEANRWSKEHAIQQVGNLSYAPYANNAAFFEQHHKKMLVINGVDTQTNSHSTGVLHSWSGRSSAGYPSLPALFAAVYGAQLPLAYINYGGYAETAQLVRYTRLDDVNALLTVLKPNALDSDNQRFYRSPKIVDKVMAYQNQRLVRLLERDSNLPRQRYAMRAYSDARNQAKALEGLAEVIPAASELQAAEQASARVRSNLKLQMQLSLLAFSAGVGCSANLALGGFDTHSDHDRLHEPLLAHLCDSVDYFWQYANELGIADRITLVMGSDFGRTPYYNASAGKDHWSIGSVIVMENSPSWGNRVVGGTDVGLLPYSIDSENPGLSKDGGIVIRPEHVHQALRHYLGLQNQPVLQAFPFRAHEILPFFS